MSKTTYPTRRRVPTFMMAQGLAALAPAQTALWFSEGFRAAHPDVLERTVRSFVRTDRVAFAATCGLLSAFDARPLLQGLRVPAAILVGEADCATPPAMTAALQAGLPHATCTVVPGAGHFAAVEAPEFAASLLLGLLHGGQASGAPRVDRCLEAGGSPDEFGDGAYE